MVLEIRSPITAAIDVTDACEAYGAGTVRNVDRDGAALGNGRALRRAEKRGVLGLRGLRQGQQRQREHKTTDQRQDPASKQHRHRNSPEMRGLPHTGRAQAKRRACSSAGTMPQDVL
jgi:hypothetical protein